MQNGRTNADTNGVYVTTKLRPQIIQEPVKLLFQCVYIAIATIPLIISSLVGYFFTKEESVKGKVVLVTGAARGLGRELCRKFASAGASIACVDIEEEGNNETAELVKKENPNSMVLSYRTNICSTEDIRRLHEDVNRDFGQVDIFIHNAGTVVSASLLQTEDKYMDLMVDLNLKSYFKIAREFLPSMIKRNSGHIVAICSLSAVQSVVNLSLYAATKHGVLAFMESLRDELEHIPDNKVKTTCICPYFIRTNLNYSVEWNLRLPEMPVSFAARHVLNAVKKNRILVSIPHCFYSLCIILRLLPDSVRNLVREVFYVHITPRQKAKEVNGNAETTK